MSWVNLNDLYATKSELATKVPTSRTINGKALSSNVTLAASDIKLSDSTTLQSAWDSISPTTLWSGKVNSGTIELSESIYNYSVVGFWTCIDGTDDVENRLVLCGVNPSMELISGGSCGMSASDIRDIRVGFGIESATTLSYINVIRTLLYLNEWTVQRIYYYQNVFGVVGVVKA